MLCSFNSNHRLFKVIQHHNLIIIRSSRWHRNNLVKVTPVVSQELLSVGDALRDLDAKNLLRSDFVLVTGDVVSNLDLGKVLQAHKQRKQTDKNSIMTMVLKEASPDHRSR